MSTDVLRRVNFFHCSSVALRCAPSPAHPGVRFVLTRTRRALLHRQVCVHQRRHRWLRRRVRDDMPQAVQCHADLLARTQRLVASPGGSHEALSASEQVSMALDSLRHVITHTPSQPPVPPLMYADLAVEQSPASACQHKANARVSRARRAAQRHARAMKEIYPT